MQHISWPHLRSHFGSPAQLPRHYRVLFVAAPPEYAQLSQKEFECSLTEPPCHPSLRRGRSGTMLEIQICCCSLEHVRLCKFGTWSLQPSWARAPRRRRSRVGCVVDPRRLSQSRTARPILPRTLQNTSMRQKLRSACSVKGAKLRKRWLTGGSEAKSGSPGGWRGKVPES